MHYTLASRHNFASFAHVIFIEINVDKIINAFTKIFCKRCQRLSHPWYRALHQSFACCINDCFTSQFSLWFDW